MSDTHASPRDRRKHRRVPYPATVVLIASGEVETVTARDISGGGISLRARRAPPVGSRVKVEFDLGKDRHYAVWGTVVWHEPTRSGEPAGFAVMFDAQSDAIGELRRELSDWRP